MFTLTRHELEAFEAVCSGKDSIKKMTDGGDYSGRTAYRLVTSLRQKGLLFSGNTNEDGLKPSSSLHSAALRRYVTSKRHPLDVITGSKLLILISISSSPKSLDTVAEETLLSRGTVRVLACSLRNSAVLTVEDDMMRIPRSNAFMTQFLQDFARGANMAMVQSKAREGTVLWSEGLECIFSAASTTVLEGMSKTAASAFHDYGIQLIGYTTYYHMAHWRPKLRAEDLALHQLLIDPQSTRGISYSLLLLRKVGFNRDYLTKEAKRLRVWDLVKEMIHCLSGLRVHNPLLPEMTELEELFREYGVM